MISTPFTRSLAPESLQPETMAVVSDRAVERALTPALLLSTVESTLLEVGAGRALTAEPIAIALDDADGPRLFKAMAGVLPEKGVAGVKWVGTFNWNAKRGLPRAPATILVTNAATGALLGAVAATTLTAYRTAAMATVAAKYCAAPAPRRAAILGFGAIGQAAALLLPAQFDLAEIRVWGGNPERVARDAKALAAETAVPIVPAASAEEAVAGADVVVTASGLTGDAPFLRHAMLRDGAFVCTLGSYQEAAADVVLAADLLIADDWAACSKRGSLAPLVKAGDLDRASLSGTLAELCAGAIPPRSAASGLAVAAMTGMGVLDVALAEQVLRTVGPRP